MPAPTTLEKVQSALSADPHLTNQQIADRVGVSVSTAAKYAAQFRATLPGAPAGAGAPGSWARAAAALDGPAFPAADKLKNGEWLVVTDPPTSLGDGSYSIAIGGTDHKNAQTAAQIAAYPGEGVDDRVRELADAGAKVTVMVAAETWMGGTGIRIYSGRLFTSGGNVAILPGTAKRNGKYVSGGSTRVLDVIEHTGARGEVEAQVAELNRRFQAGTGAPPLTPVTAEALARASEDAPVAVVSTHPGFVGGSGPVPGTVWLVTDYDRDSDIVSGYLWAPEDCDLFSEYGTVYGSELREAGMSAVSPRIGMDEVGDLPGDRSGAYRALFGS